MDQDRFDRIVRALGAGSTRRAGLRAALGGLLGMGLGAGIGATAALDADAKRSGAGMRKGRDADAARKRRRRKCSPACASSQTCVKGTCVCDDGGTACGAACCLIGQRCEGGACVDLPEPGSCIAFGEPCKNAGRRCCENLQCGSGQGGQDDVACWVRKTGRCTSTAECIYGTDCVDGICIAVLPPPPAPPTPPAPVCKAFEEACVAGADTCCDALECAGTVGNPASPACCIPPLGVCQLGRSDSCCAGNDPRNSQPINSCCGADQFFAHNYCCND